MQGWQDLTPSALFLEWQKLTPHPIFSRHTILKEWETHQGPGGDTKGLDGTPVSPLPLAPPPKASCQETFEVVGGIYLLSSESCSPPAYELGAGTTLHCAITPLIL